MFSTKHNVRRWLSLLNYCVSLHKCGVAEYLCLQVKKAQKPKSDSTVSHHHLRLPFSDSLGVRVVSSAAATSVGAVTLTLISSGAKYLEKSSWYVIVASYMFCQPRMALPEQNVVD